MRQGIYNGKKVKVHDSAGRFIIEYSNGTSIEVKDTSDIDFNIKKEKKIK